MLATCMTEQSAPYHTPARFAGAQCVKLYFLTLTLGQSLVRSAAILIPRDVSSYIELVLFDELSSIINLGYTLPLLSCIKFQASNTTSTHGKALAPLHSSSKEDSPTGLLRSTSCLLVYSDAGWPC